MAGHFEFIDECDFFDFMTNSHGYFFHVLQNNPTLGFLEVLGFGVLTFFFVVAHKTKFWKLPVEYTDASPTHNDYFRVNAIFRSEDHTLPY